MKTKSCLIIILMSILSGCSPIAIDDDGTDDSSNPPSGEDTPVDTSGGKTDTYSVSEALALSTSESKYIRVRGYIVGHILNRTYFFSIPEAKANTNFLIADQPYETREAYCMPIGLNKGDEFQPELNLLDHPEYFQRPIIIGGNTTSYFSKCGIRVVLTYQWDDSDSSTLLPPGIDTTDTDIINGRMSFTH